MSFARKKLVSAGSREVREFSVPSLVALSLAAALACGLSACNDGGHDVNGDWVQDPANPGSDDGKSTAPTPSPTPTSSPSPVPTGSDLYTGPAEVEPYVTKFVSDALIQGLDVLPKMRNPKLEIRIASLDAYGASVIGLCETAGSMRRVTFDPDFWNSVSETQRELVSHHELGHCVLYRGHTSTLLPSGAYGSIMYPIIMSSSMYGSNYDYYQKELFGTNALQSPAAEADDSSTHVCDGAIGL